VYPWGTLRCAGCQDVAVVRRKAPRGAAFVAFGATRHS